MESAVLEAIVQERSTQTAANPIRPYLMALACSVLAVASIPHTFLGGEFPLAVVLAASVTITSWLYGKGPGVLCAVATSVALCFYLFAHGRGALSVANSVGLCLFSGFIGHRFSQQRANMIRVSTENEHLNKIVDLAPVGLALMSIDRKLVRSNPALRRMFGLREDQGDKGHLPLPESKRAEWQELGEQLRRGEPYLNVETLRKRSDGTEFYAHISATPLINERGDSIELVGAIADATTMHRGHLERYVLESLVHRSVDFICVSDLEQNILFINDLGRQLVGISEESASRTLRFPDLFTGPNSDLFRRSILPKLIEGNSDLQLRLELTHFGRGLPVSVLCNLFSIHDPTSDETVCIGCVAHLSSGTTLENLSDVPMNQAPGWRTSPASDKTSAD